MRDFKVGDEIEYYGTEDGYPLAGREGEQARPYSAVVTKVDDNLEIFGFDINGSRFCMIQPSTASSEVLNSPGYPRLIERTNRSAELEKYEKTVTELSIKLTETKKDLRETREARDMWHNAASAHKKDLETCEEVLAECEAELAKWKRMARKLQSALNLSMSELFGSDED